MGLIFDGDSGYRNGKKVLTIRNGKVLPVYFMFRDEWFDKDDILALLFHLKAQE